MMRFDRFTERAQEAAREIEARRRRGRVAPQECGISRGVGCCVVTHPRSIGSAVGVYAEYCLAAGSGKRYVDLIYQQGLVRVGDDEYEALCRRGLRPVVASCP